MNHSNPFAISENLLKTLHQVEHSKQAQREMTISINASRSSAQSTRTSQHKSQRWSFLLTSLRGFRTAMFRSQRHPSPALCLRRTAIVPQAGRLPPFYLRRHRFRSFLFCRFPHSYFFFSCHLSTSFDHLPSVCYPLLGRHFP
jgi:hypothetical protein